MFANVIFQSMPFCRRGVFIVLVVLFLGKERSRSVRAAEQNVTLDMFPLAIGEGSPFKIIIIFRESV